MTTNAKRFTEAVHALGPIFAERAAAHDREGRFVTENYRELKEQRFFSLSVPSELGGGGLSHRETADVLRELAHYCPSTALTLSMHMHLLAATVFRHLRGQPGEALLRKVAGSELVLVSTGAGDWIDSVGRAERTTGGYRVSGLKRFCSGAQVGDLLITSAPLEEAGHAPEVLHFPVSLKAEGVRLRDDWDTLGMRATGSQSVELENVFVPEETVALHRPRGKWHPVWDVVIGVAAPLYMAPYVGAAEQAATIARQKIRGREPDAITLLTLGEMENQLTLAQMAWREMVELTNDFAFDPNLELTNRMLIRKTLLANAVRATVDKAFELCGGAAFFTSLGLERLFRDLQGATFHPLPEKKQLVFTGRVALGLSPVAETGG